MSSSQPFQPSSPLSGFDGRRRKSRFTYKHFAQLASFSTSSPLRVIAHVDLDAFYAQCELVRLGVPEDQPLAVQQWQGIIAINYPARDFNLSRHVTPTEAKKACPHIHLQHVPTWREGDTTWAYRDDAAEHIATDKVSLDPYRLESRKIMACIKESLPKDAYRLEKAGVDEVFLDLSRMVHDRLLERFPEELSGPPPYNDSTENLSMPGLTVLDWKADALVDLDEGLTEDDDPDWDDVAILIGSEIVRDMRAAIRQKLKYTCSGGIAQNKVLAKLGSAHKKPNQQTIVRNRAVQQFLSGFKFTKIRGLGGKLGEQISSAFGVETVKELLTIPIEQLKQNLGDESGSWVHHVIRGTDHSEVNSRTQIKSMLSAKSFRPSINNPEQAHRWLRIFAADIYARLVDEGVLENKRRPKTMNLHHRTGGQTKSRQAPISLGKKIDENGLFELAKSLLSQIVLEGRVWPCANLSLSVGGFEDGVSGNMGIGAFLVKGDEAKAIASASRESSASEQGQERPEKRRRVEGSSGIQRFLVKTDTADEYDEEYGAQDGTGTEEDVPVQPRIGTPGTSGSPNKELEDGLNKESASAAFSYHYEDIRAHICSRCGAKLRSSEELQSHQDWHFAKDLQEQDRASTPAKSESTSNGKKVLKTNNKKNSNRHKPEKGQSKLAFG